MEQALKTGGSWSRHLADTALLGAPLIGAQIAQLARTGDAAMAATLREWLTLLAELIHTAQCTIDMECVVLGGGLSRIPDVAQMLGDTYRAHQITGRETRFAVAHFGDASGTRGAAMLVAQS